MTLQSRLADLVAAIGADIKDLKSKTSLISPAPPDSWHTIGTAGEPAFGVKWQAFAPYTPQFKKMPDGTVRIRGMVAPAPSGGGAFTTVFTLPAGYRPSADVLQTALMSNGSVELLTDIRVATNGDVQFGAASSSYHTIDMSFPTDVAAVSPVIQSSVGQEGWHLVGTSGEPAFGAGFSNYAGETAAGFRKDPSGQVFLRGLVNAPAVAAGQTATVFTLPVGYRPTATIRAIAPGGGGTAFYRILTDGSIQLFNAAGFTSVASANWIDLSEITFFVDQTAFPASTTASILTVAQEGWHTVGAAGEPAFQNSWVHYDQPGGRVAKFRKDPAGMVILEGIIKGGADGTVAFTLPAGYRPDQTHFFAVRGTAGATLVSVQVATDGTVSIYGAGAAPAGYSYLNGVAFDTGQSTFPAGSTASADVQTFAGSGTWVKPVGAKSVHVVCIGAGSGGAGGSRGLSTVIRNGGPGGGGGAYTERTLRADDLGASEAVVVGVGGAGGAAAAGDSANGSAGLAGGATTFGANKVVAGGGTASPGGFQNQAAGPAGQGGTGLFAGSNGSSGGISGTSVGAASGGGSGAGLNASSVAIAAGGAGLLAASGVAASAAGTPGFSNPAGTPLPGQGGGGAVALGGAGSLGGNYGGGGGGGGGNTNGSAAGAGAKGGDGICVVTTYF
jgi:hypothetical protein